MVGYPWVCSIRCGGGVVMAVVADCIIFMCACVGKGVLQ